MDDAVALTKPSFRQRNSPIQAHFQPFLPREARGMAIYDFVFGLSTKSKRVINNAPIDLI